MWQAVTATVALSVVDGMHAAVRASRRMKRYTVQAVAHTGSAPAIDVTSHFEQAGIGRSLQPQAREGYRSVSSGHCSIASHGI